MRPQLEPGPPLAAATSQRQRAKEIIFGAGYTSGVFVGGTNGFNTRIITPIDADIAADKSVGTAGTYAATANQVGNAVWVMQGVAFRVA